MFSTAKPRAVTVKGKQLLRAEEGGERMKVSYNPDEEIVATVKEGLERTGGYCPCRVERTEDTKCMCKEFRDQLKDPIFEGFCHCLLYYKSLED